MSYINRKAIADQKAREQFKVKLSLIAPKVASDANKVQACKHYFKLDSKLEILYKELDAVNRRYESSEEVGLMSEIAVTSQTPDNLEDALKKEKLKEEIIALEAEMKNLGLSNADRRDLELYFDWRAELVKSEAQRRISRHLSFFQKMNLISSDAKYTLSAVAIMLAVFLFIFNVDAIFAALLGVEHGIYCSMVGDNQVVHGEYWLSPDDLADGSTCPDGWLAGDEPFQADESLDNWGW